MEKIHIDLKVPRGWQQCSTRELEMIAEEILRSQMMASLSRFHPFDWVEIKTRLFFRFAGVEILDIRTKEQNDSPQENVGNEQENMSLCSSVEKESFRCRKGDVEFPLETWQVHSFLEQLKWLDATDAKGRPLPMPKMLFPYPERLPHRPFRPMPLWTAICHPLSGLWREAWPWPKEYYAPGELLDGVKWEQYRLASEWMEEYTKIANRIVELQEQQGAMTDDRRRELADLQRREQKARREVVINIFGCPRYRVSLARIGDVEWQVLMFWWASVMQYLKEQYPKCFKSPSKSKKHMPLPLEMYVNSTGTLEKFLKQREGDIKDKTAHLILYHLNQMAVEAEEMEKIRRKNK